MSQSQSEQVLKFKGNILSDNGSEQLTALKTLLTGLKSLSDECDKSSLKKVAEQLVDTRILRSRDAGVQAHGACCVIEIFRVYAPNAPYTKKNLTDIFNLIINKLFRHLTNQDHPYFQQVHMLLENMVQIHVIALVCDLNNAETFINSVFTQFYKYSNEPLVPGLDILMTGIMSQLIEYYTNPLPSSVVALVLSNFLGYPKESKDSTNRSLTLNVPVGYTMSKALCTDNVDVMVKYTNQYFSDLLHKSEDVSDDEEDDEESQSYDDNIKEDDRTTTLLVEIWRAVPDLLVYVIGQLQQDLQVDDLRLRTVATESIGKMIRYTTVRSDFVRDHHAAYVAWLGRVRDRSTNIRIIWTEAAGQILEHRHHVSKDLVQNFVQRLDDTDERVRIKACNVAGDLSIQTVVNKISPHYRNEEVFGALANRMRDKRPHVRVRGFLAAGKLYDKAVGVPHGDIFSWIPSKIFEQLYLNDKAVNDLIDETEFEFLFPAEMDSSKRATRLLTALKGLSDHASKSFNALCKRQVETARYVNLLLVTIKKRQTEPTNDKILSQLAALKKFFSDMFSQPDKIGEAIDTLVNSNDRTLCKFVGTCVNPDSEYKAVMHAISEVQKRAPLKVGSSFKQLLYRSSYILYNKSILEPVIEISRAPGAPLSSAAHSFLKELATHSPALLSTQATRLTDIIRAYIPGDEGASDTLKAANLLFHKSASSFPQDEAFMDTLYKIGTEGTPNEAKYAVRLFKFSDKKEMHYDNLLNEIVTQFDKCATPDQRNEAKLSTKLSALAQLSLDIPDAVEEFQETITPYLIKNFILSNENPQKDSTEGHWVEDHDLDEYCMRKILSLRVFVNRLRAHESYENVQEIAGPLFKMLLSLIGNGGEISKAQDTPPEYRVRLRLEAGQKLLKLARTATFDKMIRATDLSKLGLLLQEENVQVRSRLINKITRYLSLPTDGLPKRYLGLVFLMAYEVDDEVYGTVTTWIRAQFARLQQSQKSDLTFELSYARLISLLAHHQEYFNDEQQEQEDLSRVMHYLLYFLTLIATQENLSVIFYVAQRLKQYRDYSEDEEDQELYSQRLYLLSDFSQFLMIRLRDLRGWTLDVWPGKLNLPHDAFKPMPSTTVAKKIAKMSFMKEGYQDALESEMKKALHHKLSSKDNKDERAKQEVKDEEQEQEQEQEQENLISEIESEEEDEPKSRSKARTKAKVPVKAPKRARPVKEQMPSDVKPKRKKSIPDPEPEGRRRSGRARKQVDYAQEDDE